MIDTDRYDDEGIELSDGGTICFPESDGRIERVDYWGNTMEVRYLSNNEGQEWYELFDTHKDLLAEIKRLREQLAKANKYVYSICQHSDSMLMDYEDYMGFVKGDEEE